MSQQHQDRPLAVVTGASSGIGAATARALARAGFHVVCAARRADRLRELATDIHGTAIACDVTCEDSVASLRAEVERLGGGELAVLVNNAGGAFGLAPVAEADSEQCRRMYDVNVIGLMQVTHGRRRGGRRRTSTSTS